MPEQTLIFRQRERLLVGFLSALFLSAHGVCQEPGVAQFRVPLGFQVEKVAGFPLVRYPMLACFDDRGRLYVAEGTGLNAEAPELVEKKLGRITLLEDTDGDGRFDKSTVFADKLIFPQGVLWHDGIVYTASHPSIWRLEDVNGDDRADRIEPLVSGFKFGGNGCDIHGPFLGPEGRLYWTDGRWGYDVVTKEGTRLEGLASRIWRCRLDGSEIERLCGGGFDNPVELAWTPEGDLLGTMDQGEGDALLHYVEGGVYPKVHPANKEFVRTGPLLGAVTQYSAALPVALCGLMRYRSKHLGSEYENTFFTAQFNVHRIEQTVLEGDGATFRGTPREFFSSPNYDVHPTDVLEDGDGSLLIVDMGAWFIFGCPTSKIDKPEVFGSIYRVRRQGAPPVPAPGNADDDPWGANVPWGTLGASRLVEFLDDPRTKVRDRAIHQLSKLPAPELGGLVEFSRRDGVRSEVAAVSTRARRNAVWALARSDAAAAMSAVREALDDKDRSVRAAALHAVGVERDAQALPALVSLVTAGEPPLRLKAAEALGRIGKPEAVPALLEGLRGGVIGRFLEHALIYALIRINDRKSVLAALDDPAPHVRRAGLIALDQMVDGDLSRDIVLPLLDTDDPELQEETLSVIGAREEWAGEVLGLLEKWLGPTPLSVGQERSLTGVLLGYSGDSKTQELVADALRDAATPTKKRLLLLDVMARARVTALPESWTDALKRAMSDTEPDVARGAVNTIRTRGLTSFDEDLVVLSRKDGLPTAIRIAALASVSPRQPQLAPEAFALLTDHVIDDSDPLVRVTAARALGSATLKNGQLVGLTQVVERVGPMLVPLLVPAFLKPASRSETKEQRTKIGLALVGALKASPGRASLSLVDLNGLFSRFPSPDVRTIAKGLVSEAVAREREQRDYLAQLTAQVAKYAPGDPERGRKIFFSKKSGCYTCHKIGERGGQVGPDLSRIGAIRWPGDLLESVVFPSSAMAESFRPYLIVTKGGDVATGLIARETSDAVFLRTAERAEIRIGRDDIADMRESSSSIMPAGLEKTMSARQLSDLLEFLYRCR